MDLHGGNTRENPRAETAVGRWFAVDKRPTGDGPWPVCEPVRRKKRLLWLIAVVTAAVGSGAGLRAWMTIHGRAWSDLPDLLLGAALQPVFWLKEGFFLPAMFFGWACVWLSVARRPAVRGPRRRVLAVAGVYGLYAVYEWHLHAWEKTVSAPVRLDLMLFAPFLYLCAFLGLKNVWRGFRAMYGAGAGEGA